MAEGGGNIIRQGNFTRLIRLLICDGTRVVRGYFDIQIRPEDLAVRLSDPAVNSILQNLRRRSILTLEQWNILYPPAGTVVRSQSFDITLLFKLLRNICGLTAPGTGWNNLPNPADITLEADLARIRYYRNTIYAHTTEMELSNVEFERYWEEVRNALLRIFGHYSSDEEVEAFRMTIDEYRNAPDLIVTCVITIAYVGEPWLVGSCYILYRYRDDPETLVRLLNEVVLVGCAVVLAISEGSIKINIMAESLKGLEELWNRYETGQLREVLENVLITQDLNNYAIENGVRGKLELEVDIRKDEYENARRYLISKEKMPSALPEKPKKGTQKESVKRTVRKFSAGKKGTEKEKVLEQGKVIEEEKELDKEKGLEQEKVPEHPPTDRAEGAKRISDIKEEQFVRLTRLLGLGVPVFRELFDSKFPPKDLASKLKEPKILRILTRLRGTKFSDTEWDILFPDPRSPYLVKSKEFDMDLLLKLLEEICAIDPPPYTGWHNLPKSDEDKSLGAQLARFKWYRLGIYARVNKYREVADEMFHSYWTKVKDVLLDIVRVYDASKVRGYREAIDNLLTCPISGYPDIILRCSFKLVLALHGELSMGISTYVEKSFNSKIENLMKLEEIFPNGVLVRNVTHGSLKVVVWAIEIKALEKFWRSYKKGKLDRDLRKVLLREEIKSMTIGGEVKMTMNVDETDYEAARENLLSYTAFEPHGFIDVDEEESWEAEETPEQYESKKHRDDEPRHPSRVRELLIEILHGEPLEDRTSIFQAHLAEITSSRQVRSVLRELRIQKKSVADAAFVVWAYRISSSEKRFYAEKSVGSYEYFAARRVFNLLEREDATNVIVIVTCWQGDVPALGMDTYENISKCARELLLSFLKSSKKILGASKTKLPTS